jgi:hypothetical protein
MAPAIISVSGACNQIWLFLDGGTSGTLNPWLADPQPSLCEI